VWDLDAKEEFTVNRRDFSRFLKEVHTEIGHAGREHMLRRIQQRYAINITLLKTLCAKTVKGCVTCA